MTLEKRLREDNMNTRDEITKREIEAEFRYRKQLSEVALILIVSAAAVGAVIASWLHYAQRLHYN
jgi:hypothetical protein